MTFSFVCTVSLFVCSCESVLSSLPNLSALFHSSFSCRMLTCCITVIVIKASDKMKVDTLLVFPALLWRREFSTFGHHKQFLEVQALKGQLSLRLSGGSSHTPASSPYRPWCCMCPSAGIQPELESLQDSQDEEHLVPHLGLKLEQCNFPSVSDLRSHSRSHVSFRYLVKHSSTLFSATDYEVAPPEYHRKAVWGFWPARPGASQPNYLRKLLAEKETTTAFCSFSSRLSVFVLAFFTFCPIFVACVYLLVLPLHRRYIAAVFFVILCICMSL